MGLPIVNLSLIPTFPGKVFGDGPITIDKSGLNYTIGLDLAEVSVNPAPDSHSLALSYNDQTGVLELVVVTNLPVDWGGISGLPPGPAGPSDIVLIDGADGPRKTTPHDLTMAGLQTGALRVDGAATGILSVGNPAFAPETLTYTANGVVVFAVSENVIQLNQDNIVLAKNPWGSNLSGSNMTWKAPNPVALGNDIPFLNIGFRNGGTGEVLFEGGWVAAIPSLSLPATKFPIGFYTADSTTASALRLFLDVGDNDAIGIGTGSPQSEFQGAFVHIHASSTGVASQIHFTTDATTSAATAGGSVGVMTDSSLRLWNYGNNPLVFGVTNAERARITATGLGIGGSPSEKLHVIASAAGAVLSRMRIDAVNTSSGKTSSLQFYAQDNGAGTIRGVLSVPGPLNGGASDQGGLDVFTEDGSLRMVMIDSMAANSAARLLVYDRSGTARITLTGSTATPVLNLVATGGEYRVNGVKVLGARQAGWAAATGTATRSTFVTSTVTLPVLAEHVKALIDDLITHGVIGA